MNFAIMYSEYVANGLKVEYVAVAKMGDWARPRSVADRSFVPSSEMRGRTRGTARMRNARRMTRREKVEKRPDLVLFGLRVLDFRVGVAVRGATLKVGNRESCCAGSCWRLQVLRGA